MKLYPTIELTRASIKPGTRNIPEHGIIIIIMRKICKIEFKNKLVSAWKIKRTTKQNKNVTN